MTTVRAIIGPPGTGKTTTVANLVGDAVRDAYDAYRRPTRAPALVCSLTRAAAAEAAGRDTGLPRDCVGTLHAFAYRALDRPPLVAGKEGDFNRLPHLPIAWRIPSSDTKDTDDPYAAVSGIESPQSRYHLLRATMTPRDRWPQLIQQWAARYERWKSDDGLLDFDDLIEVAARDVSSAPGHPTTLYMDEAQDSSRLLLSLARTWGARADELVLVGDPWQSIYHFAGAYPGMFYSKKIQHTDVLGQSYRVPRAVHRLATSWVRQLTDWRSIEYEPRAEAGEVGRIGGQWRTPAQIVAIAEREAAQGRTVMIQATCAYMLGPTLSMLKSRGTPYGNRWRRKNGAWNPLAPRRGTSMADRIRALYRLDGTWIMRDVHAWASKLVSEKALNHGAKASIKRAAENTPDTPMTGDEFLTWFKPGFLDSLDAAAVEANDNMLGHWWSSGLDAKTKKAAEFPLRVRERHGASALDEEPRITVGTTHSLKGSEADTVIVFPDLSRAGAKEWSAGGVRRDEVVRLGYVAATRAREKLLITAAAGDSMPLSRYL